MGKFNLSDAAKQVLSEGAKETFDANVASKRGQRGGEKAPHGEVGKDKLHGDVAYGTHEVDVGHTPTKTQDHNPDYTKGTPSATPPGATPPVGSQPAHHLDKDKDMQSHGRHDLVSSEEGDEHDAESIQAIADRKPSKLAKQTMHANPGAHFQQYEETESEEEVFDEAWHKEEKEKADHERREHIKTKMKEKCKEDIDALMSGENLSEEFVTKATTIFEAAVVARAESIVEEIEGELLEQFDDAVEAIKEELAAKVDDYLNYMVQEWVTENQIAIQSGLKAEIVEDFISG